MEINKRAVFAKTPKGKDEIETRQNRLPAKLRMALILVDGKSSVTDLVDKGSHPDLVKTLEELSLLGFIRDVSMSAVPTPPPAAPNFPASTTVKLELIRISREILGPQAEKIVKKIEESADTKEALAVTLKNCIELVRLVVDEKKSKALGIKYTETLNRS